MAQVATGRQSRDIRCLVTVWFSAVAHEPMNTKSRGKLTYRSRQIVPQERPPAQQQPWSIKGCPVNRLGCTFAVALSPGSTLLPLCIRVWCFRTFCNLPGLKFEISNLRSSTTRRAGADGPGPGTSAREKPGTPSAGWGGKCRAEARGYVCCVGSSKVSEGNIFR